MATHGINVPGLLCCSFRGQSPPLLLGASSVWESKKPQPDWSSRADPTGLPTQELLFQTKDQFLQARASDRLLSLYKTALIPQTTLTLESAISSYEVGSVDFLTLVSAAIVLLDYELEYYGQLATYQKALASLEPIVGKTLIP